MRRFALLGTLLTGALVLGMGVAQAAPAAAPAGPGSGERWALVIGIDHFQGNTRPNLGAVGDAEDVKSALLAAGVKSDHIKVLEDGAATNAGIRDGLSWLAKNATDTSFSIIHYSGHVKQEGRTEYLWPHDNHFISDNDFAGSVRAVKGRVWVDIAGCEAAGFDEGISGPNRLFTAASQENEKGYELPAELRNSVFTSLLWDKGLWHKAADFNHDGKVSIQEAFKLAADNAPSLTANESNGPQHPLIAGGDGTPWYLEKPASSAAATAFAKKCLICL